MFTNTSFEMHCWQEIKWCVIILTYVELVYTHYVPGEIKTKKIWSIINVISLLCLSMTIMLAHGRKGIMWIRKSKKNRQHNGQKKKDKRTNNDLREDYMLVCSTTGPFVVNNYCFAS
jgi:hypothetical protein